MTFNFHNRLREGFGAMLKVGPIDAIRANWSESNARSVAKQFQRKRLHDANDYAVEAVRHCAWNFDMTKKIGAQQAKSIADFRETVDEHFEGRDCVSHFKYTPLNSMNFHNNHVGRWLGQSPSYRNLSTLEACERAFDENRLMTAPDLRPGGSDGNPRTPW